MLRARASTDPSVDPSDGERGSASLEFLLVVLVLLVPVVYIVVALGTVQGQALGAETGARQLARTIASAPDAETADARAERVLDAIVAEYGLDRSAIAVEVSCAAPATQCPAAGAVLTVTLTAAVTLPLVPSVLGAEGLARVPVQSTAVQKVSRYWVGAP